MLRELHISGLGVIDDLDLELHPGLNVLTGETGAGKTMVTVGLALALGTRADSSLVRDGREGRPRPGAVRRHRAAPSEWSEDGEVLLARSVNADGKSSARVGGQLATASTLAELGGALVEVHGQHQAQRLLSPTTQTGFLDRFAGDAHLVALAAYRETWERWRDARAALEALEASTRERERELDLLAYQVQRDRGGRTRATARRSGLTVEEARLAHVERLLERSTRGRGDARGRRPRWATRRRPRRTRSPRRLGWIRAPTDWPSGRGAWPPSSPSWPATSGPTARAWRPTPRASRRSANACRS